ncbi:hypothetical protein SO802_020893 [Lithocarpus litseifolius]|uniref:Uncharacterized protein n=1 Tax=Lithocarpus litseifolius TaxID=425828 RepID=A0AAW2CDM9_9ROSI
MLKVMPVHLKDLIEKINQSNDDDQISCVIASIGVGWALEVAEKMGIKRAAVWPAGPGELAFVLHIPKLIQDGMIDTEDTTDGPLAEFLHMFRTRLNDRGMIVEWAPQEKVLDHPSIACFGYFDKENETCKQMTKKADDTYEGKQPHVLVITAPAQSHVASLMKLSHKIVEHGIKVTFVNTKFIHAKVTASMPIKSEEKSPISLVSIPDGQELGDD